MSTSGDFNFPKSNVFDYWAYIEIKSEIFICFTLFYEFRDIISYELDLL